MNRKIYFAPSAELMMLVPTEEIASWQWNWDSYSGKETASIMGTLQVFENQNGNKPWEYGGKDTPY